MSGDISLSQALGGLRIANLSNDSLPESNTPQEDKPSASAADDHQNGHLSSQPLNGAAGPSSTSSPLARTPLDRPAEPNDARPLHTTNNHPTAEAPVPGRSAAGFEDYLGEPRLQRQHTAPLHPASHDSERAQHTSTRPVSAAFAGPMSMSQDSDASSSYYQPMLRPETSQSSMFDAISRSNSRSVRTPYAGPIPQRVPSRRIYNPDAMRDLPPGVAPPRKSSRNQGGGYPDPPPGAMAPPQSGNNFGAQMPAPGNREEWQERGAAVGVRREVDSEGRAILRSVKKGVKDFKFDRILGEGSYSTVYLATDRGNNKEYAVKVLEKKHIIKEKKIKYVNIEKNTLNRLTDHPGIVRLIYTFQDETSLYYVLDLCGGGELLGVLKRTGTFDVDCTRFYGAEILDAIDYMHSRGVIHRDLKPENVLLDSGMHVKITDFGTAKLLPDPRDPKPPADDASEDGRAASFVGTAEYVSPELLTDKTAGKASDIWAFGCIIYQLLAGRPPFKAGTEYLTFQKIVGLEYEFPPGFPPAARDLVERCLVLDPAMRLTVEHIKNHEFFDGIRVSRLLWKQKAPRLRPYVPPAQEPHIIQLNGASSSSLPQSRQLPSSSNGATRPSRIITELPPPTQLDIEWSPVLTKSNERILKLGDLIVTSSPVPNSPHGKQDHETHRKISKFFTGSTLKKKQRLVMVTSSGRIVLAPAGGGEKKAKLEISLLNPDCVWRTQLDTKGQVNWSVDSNGTHYLFEQPKSSSSLSVDAGTAHDWVEALEKAKDLAISQDLMGSDNGFGDMPSSLSSSPSNTLSHSMQFSEGGFGVADRAGRHHFSKSQASLDDPQQTKKTHRFSKRQSKNGLGTAAF